MFNKKSQRTIALIIVWVLAIALVVTTFPFSAFAAEGEYSYTEGTEEGSVIGLSLLDTQLSSEAQSEELEAEAASLNETTVGSLAYAEKAKTLELQLEEMGEVLEYIEKTYVDEIDINELIDGAYNGVLEQLDPYSEYYKDSGEGDSFMSYATGVFYGIGVVFENDEEGVIIKSFLTDSPAAKAGVKIGDLMLSVDGASVEGKKASEVAQAVRSTKEGAVSIAVLRDGKRYSFKINRSVIKDTSVSYKMADEKTAYVNITNFYESTPEEFAKAWKELKESNSSMSGMVVDIRNNPGGLVSSAVSLSNLFLNRGCTIMNYVKGGTKVYSYKADGDKIVDVPVSVLVNNGTASAAEIFAGALQDNYAALLVGSETYGKGMAQTVTELDGGASLKLSVYYFTTPDNHMIQGVGLKPSYIIYNGDNKEAIERNSYLRTIAPMNEGKKYSRGEKGLNVYAAQQRLMVLGYEDVTLSGILDVATAEALKDIQQKAGVYVYGALDFTTIDCLEREYQRNVFGIVEDIQLKKAIELTK